jgi:hypothetical protein
MALYKPDYTYIKAKEIVESLGDSEKDVAIKYYIEKHKIWHEKDIEELKKYEKFFNMLNSFLPNKNMIY